MAVDHRLMINPALLVAIGLAVIFGSAAPAVSQAHGPVPHKDQVKELVITEFGVVATVKLTKPLARAAASSPVGAGLGIGIGHRDRSFSGLVLRGSPKVKARVRGKLANAVAFTAGRTAWFFAEDSKAASIERVAVGGLGLNGNAASARASLWSGIWSGQALLDKIFGGEGPGDRGLFLFAAAVLKLATPPLLADAPFCAKTERQIRLAEDALRDAPSRYDTVLKSWAVKARAHFERHCGPPSGAVGSGGKAEVAQEGSGTPGDGTPGPPANQAPSATHPESNEFVGKAGVAKPFEATTADPDGQVVSWSWDWDDGSSTSGMGADPTSAHTFAKPNLYNVRLTVTDDKGASTTDAIQVPIGGEGSGVSHDTPTIICPSYQFTPAEFTFSVRIPSYAEEPTAEVRPTLGAPPTAELCPDTIQAITTERTNGNALGAHDEWGNLKDTFTVTVTIYWHEADPTSDEIYPVAIVNWK